MSKQLIKEAFEEMMFAQNANSLGLRDSSGELYDPDHLDPGTEAGLYTYCHHSLADAVLHPHLAMSKVLLEYCPLAIAKMKEQSIKPGDILLRVINYHKHERFSMHDDIDYLTLVVGSYDMMKDEVKTSRSLHYGTQAYYCSDIKPTPHYFNPRGVDYSMVIFCNAHFSQPMVHNKPRYATVGEYLQGIYYGI